MIIRKEEINDYNKIREVVKIAFESTEHTDGTEYILVDKLRGSIGFIPELALVAEEENKILGHVMFTKVKIGNDVELALAPLAVLPSAQRKGIGTALMNNAHEIAKKLGYNLVVVLGSEQYYPRVGYKPASDLGILAPFDVPNENFMVLNLGNVKKEYSGTVEYVKEIVGE